MRKVGLLLAASCLGMSAAHAAEGSVAVTPGSGANIAATAADGAGFLSFLHGICGGVSATMGTACANQLEVDSAGKIGVTGTIAATQSGTWTVQPGNTANTTPWLTSQSPYPTGATPITASATGTTGATTATLTNVTAHTTYICGFSIRANATAAATGNATVTGTITGTLNFTQWTAPLASGLGVTEEVFSPCVPASAVSTSIAVVSAAPGTGGVVSVTAWGFSI